MLLPSILTPFALSWLMLLGAAGANPLPAKTVKDEVLLDMSQAFKQGDRKRLSALLPQARGHTLEPWAAFWELRARLDSATSTEVQAFFSRYANTYQEDRLRADWLLLLGQRRDWAGFAADLPNYRMNDDSELRCYALSRDTQADATALAGEVRRLWYRQKEADEGCSFAAAQLHAAKQLSDTDIWRKARLAIENNRPRLARQAAEIISAQAGKPVDDISSSPARFLLKKAAGGSHHKEWAVLALIRLADTDPEQAAGLMEQYWGSHLTEEQQAWAWAAIGKQAAQKLSASAGAHFARALNSHLTDDQLGWKVRAALRSARWPEVLAATLAMSAPVRDESTWVYWRARAELQLAKTEAQRDEAKRLLEGIAGVRGFYEQLALADLGQSVSMPARPPALSTEEKAAARQHLGLQRALYAIQIGLRSDGVREWNYSVNLHQRGGMSDRELLAAADLACEREVWDRCINTSERTRGVFDFEQRYPMPHREAVLTRAKQIGLDPAYVYGLIRQESRFIMDAQSSVGAAGLMQVMPPTARWTAKKIGLTDFKPNQITERDTNIAIGTGYLKLVLDNFGGSMALAAAAYNAGPSRPRSWRGQTGAPTLEAAIWAENIPFAETRDYVKKVLANTTNYAAVITGQPQSLKARLGSIGPLGPGSPDVSPDLP
ncbi:MAG: transglycosylase SLT domain-containing protein [Burkholderiales bacterium]|nr:transglycosylase SLT domain-containing protein [Burkholderiales bacterium]